jgi:hypothetical protein
MGAPEGIMREHGVDGDRIALGVLALLALVCSLGLVLVAGDDGLVMGQRGPRLGAFVHGNLAAAGLFGVGGLLLAVAAARPMRPAVLLGGAVLTAGALIHLVSLALGVDPIGGSGSTVAAYLGLGIAALAIGATPAASPSSEEAVR